MKKPFILLLCICALTASCAWPHAQQTKRQQKQQKIRYLQERKRYLQQLVSLKKQCLQIKKLHKQFYEVMPSLNALFEPDPQDTELFGRLAAQIYALEIKFQADWQRFSPSVSDPAQRAELQQEFHYCFRQKAKPAPTDKPDLDPTPRPRSPHAEQYEAPHFLRPAQIQKISVDDVADISYFLGATLRNQPPALINAGNLLTYFDVTFADGSEHTEYQLEKALQKATGYRTLLHRSSKRPVFIFIGETHYSAKIFDLVEKLIRNYRFQFGSDFRYLFAAETYRGDTLIVFPPINFFSLMLKLEPDILPLDTAQVGQILPAPQGAQVPIGSSRVLLSGDDRVSQDLLDGGIPRDMLGTTAWGIWQRNQDWARRIRLVQDDYDVIFVYAGMGHLAKNDPYSLPALLDQEDAPRIFMMDYNTSGPDASTPPPTLAEMENKYFNLLLDISIKTDWFERSPAPALFTVKPDACPRVKREAAADAWLIYTRTPFETNTFNVLQRRAEELRAMTR